MTLEETIRTSLLATPGITALVSTRVYERRLGQNPTFPAISFMRVSTSREYVQEGQSGPGWSRFQFDCWANTSGGDLALAEQVRLWINGFDPGTALASPPPGGRGSSFVLDQRSGLEDESQAPTIYRQIIDAKIWFAE